MADKKDLTRRVGALKRYIGDRQALVTAADRKVKEQVDSYISDLTRLGNKLQTKCSSLCQQEQKRLEDHLVEIEQYDDGTVLDDASLMAIHERLDEMEESVRRNLQVSYCEHLKTLTDRCCNIGICEFVPHVPKKTEKWTCGSYHESLAQLFENISSLPEKDLRKVHDFVKHLTGKDTGSESKTYDKDIFGYKDSQTKKREKVPIPEYDNRYFSLYQHRFRVTEQFLKLQQRKIFSDGCTYPRDAGNCPLHGEREIYAYIEKKRKGTKVKSPESIIDQPSSRDDLEMSRSSVTSLISEKSRTSVENDSQLANLRKAILQHSRSLSRSTSARSTRDSVSKLQTDEFRLSIPEQARDRKGAITGMAEKGLRKPEGKLSPAQIKRKALASANPLFRSSTDLKSTALTPKQGVHVTHTNNWTGMKLKTQETVGKFIRDRKRLASARVQR